MKQKRTRTLEDVGQEIKKCERIVEQMKKEVLTMPMGVPERAYCEAKLEMTKDYQGRLQAEYDMLKSVQIKTKKEGKE